MADERAPQWRCAFIERRVAQNRCSNGYAAIRQTAARLDWT